MDREKQKLSIAEVKDWDMVDYLSGLGYRPAKVRGNDYWYHSPLRKPILPEKTATKISICREAALSAPALLYYLEKRKISLPLSNKR